MLLAVMIGLSATGQQFAPALEHRTNGAAADHLPPTQARARQLIGAMNLTQKMLFLQGNGAPWPQPPQWGVGNTRGVPELHIPALHFMDGPNGVGSETRLTKVTNWPSALTVAASWDRQLLRSYGIALAQEQRGKGMNVMLGPGVNLARVPQGGRNFEYMGEDPVLASELSAAEIEGIQSEGVIACVKHFVNNAQEGPGHNGRLISSSVVGQRAQWELYYKAFEGAVKAGVGSVMCS